MRNYVRYIILLVLIIAGGLLIISVVFATKGAM